MIGTLTLYCVYGYIILNSQWLSFDGNVCIKVISWLMMALMCKTFLYVWKWILWLSARYLKRSKHEFWKVSFFHSKSYIWFNWLVRIDKERRYLWIITFLHSFDHYLKYISFYQILQHFILFKQFIRIVHGFVETFVTFIWV